MKLKRLTIENIASIESAIIDFDQAPLADERLFLITGDTGSGKSTLIDCLCLALYGSTPRMNAARKVTYGDALADDTLTTDDPRQLMRRGSAKASVTLTFDDMNGTPYVAMWEVHRAHGKVDGRLSKVARMLMTDEGVVPERAYSKKTDIESAIQELIGMDVNQFFRTVVLAQGKFAEFLNSDENVKSSLLEKMTGTAIYSQVGSKIYEVYADKRNQLEIINGQMSGITLLEEPERTALNDQISQLNKDMASTRQRLELAVAMTGWIAANHRFEQQLAEKRTRLEQRVKALNDPGLINRLAIAGDWEATIVPRLKLKELAQDNLDMESLNRQQPALQDEFDDLCAALRAAVKLLETKQRELDEVTAFIKQEEGNKEMYAAVGQIKSALKSLKAGESNIVDFTQKMEDERQRQPKVEAQVVATRDSVKSWEEKIAAWQRQLGNIGVDSINSLKDKSLAARQQLLALIEKHDAVDRQTGSLEQLRQKLLKEQNDLDKTSAAIYDKRRLHAMAQESLERMTGWNELLIQAQKTLHEGDPCPVCGNVITRVLTPKSESELDELRMQVKQAADDLREAEAHIQATRRLIADCTGQITDARGQLDKAIAEREAHWITTSQALAQCGQPVAEMVDRSAATRLIGVIDEQVGQLNETLKQATALGETITDGQRHYNTAVKTLNALTIDLNNIKASIAHQQQVINNCRREIKERIEELNGLLTMEDWKERALGDDTFIQELSHAASDYQHKVAQQQRLTQFNGVAQAAIPAMQSDKDGCTGVQDKGLVTDRVPDNLDGQWRDFEKRLLQWNTALRDKMNHARHAQQDLDDFLVQHGSMTIERLQELEHYRPEEVEGFKAEHRKLNEAVNTMQGEIAELGRQRQEHLMQKPAHIDDDPAKLESIINACQREMDGAMTRVTDLMARLQADDVNRKSLGELQLAHKQAQEECDRWEQFNKMLGSADGKTFRKIAQSYILGDLLASANGFLHQFNNRYELESDPGSLTILVRDLVMGDKTSVNTLSGGECFMVSLALALALSNLSGKVFSMDTLFIDEGFGSLSPAYLDNVMETLNRLYDVGGRRVGIISHVEMLKERVLTQIHVSRDPDNNTVSRVQVKA